MRLECIAGGAARGSEDDPNLASNTPTIYGGFRADKSLPPPHPPYIVVLVLTKYSYYPTKMFTYYNHINSYYSIVLLIINTYVANLHHNHRYSIICIRLFITLTSAFLLSPPIKRGIKAYSISAIT
jgi:hypothetical protein